MGIMKISKIAIIFILLIIASQIGLRVWFWQDHTFLNAEQVRDYEVVQQAWQDKEFIYLGPIQANTGGLYLINNNYNNGSTKPYSPLPSSGIPDTPNNISAENALANMSMQRLDESDLYGDETPLNGVNNNGLGMVAGAMPGMMDHQGHMMPMIVGGNSGVMMPGMQLQQQQQQQQQLPMHYNSGPTGATGGGSEEDGGIDDEMGDDEDDDDDDVGMNTSGVVEHVGRWTVAEHERFVQGLKTHGKVSSPCIYLLLYYCY